MTPVHILDWAVVLLWGVYSFGWQYFVVFYFGLACRLYELLYH